MILRAPGIEAPFTMWQSAPAELRMTMEIPGIGASESGCVGGVVWSTDPMQGPRLVDGAEKERTLFVADGHWIGTIALYFGHRILRSREWSIAFAVAAAQNEAEALFDASLLQDGLGLFLRVEVGDDVGG